MKAAPRSTAGKKRRWKWLLPCAIALGVAGYFIWGKALEFTYEARVSDLEASGDLLNELEAARRQVKADENAVPELKAEVIAEKRKAQILLDQTSDLFRD